MAVIAHLSDPHIAPVPFPFGFRLKPVLGWINWARKPGARDMAVLERTAAAVRAENADLVAVTGDLIELSLDAEIVRARAFLTSFGPPERLVWTPGNHDVYTTDAPARLAEAFASWLAAPGDGPDPLRARFPVIRRFGSTALVAVCSGLPTWLFSAEGEIGAAQLARLDAALEALAGEGARVALAIHHPPHTPDLSPLKRLRDRNALLSILAHRGVGTILHGHLHELCEARLAIDGASINQIGAPSASASDAGKADRAGFNRLRALDPDGFCLERVLA